MTAKDFGKPEISVLLNISAICDEEAANEVGQGNAQLVRDAWLQGLEALNTSNGGIDSEKSWLMFGHDKLPGSCLQLPTDLADDHGHPGADAIISQIIVGHGEH